MDPIAEQAAQVAHVGRHEHPPVGRRLEDAERHALAVGRQHHAVHRGEQVAELLVGHLPREARRPPRARALAAGLSSARAGPSPAKVSSRSGWRRAHPGERLGQLEDPLLRVQPAEEEQRASTRSGPSSSAQADVSTPFGIAVILASGKPPARRSSRFACDRPLRQVVPGASQRETGYSGRSQSRHVEAGLGGDQRGERDQPQPLEQADGQRGQRHRAHHREGRPPAQPQHQPADPGRDPQLEQQPSRPPEGSGSPRRRRAAPARARRAPAPR